MIAIGFANVYFTLWNVFDEGTKTVYRYVKNISKDWGEVEKLYPGVEVNYSLKGHYMVIANDSKKEEITNDRFQFGQYKYDDLECHRVIDKTVDECLWGVNDEIDVYKETDPTEKLVDDSVEFGKNVMRKKISEYLLKYLPMTPDDKELFVEEMNKNIK